MTEKTIAKAAARAEELGIKYAVVASNTGEVIQKAVGKFENLVWVTHHFSYSKPGEFEFTQEVKERMEKEGVKVLSTAHILSGVERGLSARFRGYGPGEIMSASLRMFGQGTKVAVEISTMATDAGLLPPGEKVMAIAGTAGGADTAVVITPAGAFKILDTKIHEIVCKPF